MRSSRLVCSLVTVLLLALLLAPQIPVAETADASSYSGISISIERPAYAAKSTKVQVTVTIFGGPAGDLGGNYSCTIEIKGQNTTGSLVEPPTQTNPRGVFKVNITMPGYAPQTIKLLVTATSKAWVNRDTESTNSTFEMKVLDPIVIKAEVFNTGPVNALNVTAEFYADGELLAKQIFNVTAGSSKELVYNWTEPSIGNGKHVVSIKINDPMSVVEFSDGSNAQSLTIYVGEQTNWIGGLLSIVLIIFAILVVLLWLSKPIKRKKT